MLHALTVGAESLGAVAAFNGSVKFGMSAVRAVAEAGPGLADVISGLCDGGLLAEVRGGAEPTYRFRHALIRDAAYKNLLKDQRRRLHAKAASFLEESSWGRLEEAAAVLGHHYARAGETERAAHYFTLAADHAAGAFANEEAITSVRQALELLRPGSRALSTRAAALWEKLGDLLKRVGRYEEARAAYQEGADSVVADEPLLAARCYAALGFLVSEDLQRHDEALHALGTAEQLLDKVTEKDSDEWVAAWLYLQLGLVQLYYWRDTKKAEEVLARERPVVEARGTPAERANFYMHLGHVRARASRYRVDESIVADFRAARAAAEEGFAEQSTVAGTAALMRYWMYFQVGFALFWHGDTEAALVELNEGLTAAVRTGDKLLEVLSRTFITVAYLRQGDVGAVKEMAPVLGDVASTVGLPENLGVARAAMSWVAWKEGRLDEVAALAQGALDSWESSARRYPMDWLCLFPFIGAQLSARNYKEAAEAARKILLPHQMRLPEELEAALEHAVTCWDEGQTDPVAQALETALQLAEQLNYA